jgi:hypothetical protein
MMGKLITMARSGRTARRSQLSDEAYPSKPLLSSTASPFPADPERLWQIASQPTVDTRPRRWRVPLMSDRTARIVYAPPPGKRLAPRRAVTVGKAAEVTTEALPPLTSSSAVEAFLELIRLWKLPPPRGWRMLTGVGYRAGSLTPDQIARVQHLVVIDTGMRLIKGDAVSEWMVAGNGAAVLSGASPDDFLTRAGTRGYEALARHNWVR